MKENERKRKKMKENERSRKKLKERVRFKDNNLSDGSRVKGFRDSGVQKTP